MIVLRIRRPRFRLPAVASAALLLSLSGCTLMTTDLDAASRTDEHWPTASSGQRHFDHVVIVVLENQDYSTAVHDKFLGSLAQRGILFTNFKGLFHNSYPNYLAMVGGRPFSVSWWNSDHQIDLPAVGEEPPLTIADRIPDAKNYAEDYPGGVDAYTITHQGPYVRRHVPFASFENTRGPDHIVGVPRNVLDPGHRFFIDADSPDRFPRYALYSPNVRNDGHDTGLAHAAAWLEQFLLRFNGTRAASGTLIIVTFDESAHRERSNHIYTVLLGPMLDPGMRVYEKPVNHYNVLRMIEDNFGVEPLGPGDGGAKPIDGIWR